MVKVKIVKINKIEGEKLPFAITYLVASHRNNFIELCNWYKNDDGEPDLHYTVIYKSIYLALNELAYEDGFLV